MDSIRPLSEFDPPLMNELLDDSEYWREIQVSASIFGIDPMEAHLRAMNVMEGGSFSSDEDQKRCEALLAYSESLISPYITPENRRAIVDPALRMQRRLYQYHPALAVEGVEVAELTRLTAPAVDEETGAERDRVKLWATATLHDVGNIMLPLWLINRSLEGKIWTPQDMEAKKPHSFWGRVLAHVGGLPDKELGRVIYANHALQLGDCYGTDVELKEGQERSDRDDVADADGGLAGLTRNNSRNRGMSIDERIAIMAKATELRRRDYRWLSPRNNAHNIQQRVNAVRLDYVFSQYEFHETHEGIEAVRKASGALALANA